MVVSGHMYYCCGAHVSTSDQSPKLPKDIGGLNAILKCPDHGFRMGAPIAITVDKRACQGCGMVQGVLGSGDNGPANHEWGRKAKFNLWNFRCYRCNNPLVVYAGTAQRCLRCGRNWSPEYAARRGNADATGTNMIKCPACGRANRQYFV